MTSGSANSGAIFLIGPMGAGKSTVGRRLAQRLQRDLVDLDRAIEARTGVDIPTIFDIEGEAGFRQRETAMLAEVLASQPRALVATGGGIVLARDNRELMRTSGAVIYLRATVDTQYLRVRDSRRPLLQHSDPRARLAELFAGRDPLYRQAADLVVPTDGNRTEHVITDIEAFLGSP